MVLSRLPAPAAGLVPVDCGARAAWLPIAQPCSGFPCNRVPSVPAKAAVRSGILNAIGPRAILRKGRADARVDGDAHVRVRRRKRSSAGPCADRCRPGWQCSRWNGLAREAGKFPPTRSRRSAFRPARKSGETGRGRCRTDLSPLRGHHDFRRGRHCITIGGRRPRRPAPGAIGIKASAITRDNLDPWPALQPGGHAVRVAIRRQIKNTITLQIADDRSIPLSAPPRPIIDTHDRGGNEAGHRRRPDHSKQGIAAHRHRQPMREAGARLTARYKPYGALALCEP